MKKILLIIGAIISVATIPTITSSILFKFFSWNVLFAEKFLNLRDDDYAVLFAWVCLIVAVIIVMCIIDAIPTTEKPKKVKKENNTTHTCNICDKILKKGEGKHYPQKEDKCYCLCVSCEPTVDMVKFLTEKTQ